jgi:hypothetical protein
MKSLFKIAILFLVLTLVQCSSDDTAGSNSLLVNGAAFKLAPETIVEANDGSINFILGEKTDTANGRILQVFAMHTAGHATGTYELRNNSIESGVAVVALYDQEFNQIAGGSEDQPTGNLTITHYEGKRYKLTFNDVTLDPGTASETTISGSCMKTFSTGVLTD